MRVDADGLTTTTTRNSAEVTAEMEQKSTLLHEFLTYSQIRSFLKSSVAVVTCTYDSDEELVWQQKQDAEGAEEKRSSY